MERLMQYVWQHRLWRPGRLAAVDSRRVEVIDPGTLNTGSGPDFFNAKVRIEDRVWAGDVEIHVRATDWLRHGHDRDPAYDSVVLHVVLTDDVAIHRSNGEVIPQMVLPVSPDFPSRYADVTSRSERDLPCRDLLRQMPGIYVSDWLAALALERLHAKTDRVEALMGRYAGDWREVTYVTLARGLGFGANAEPLERLALGTPFRVLAKHADDLGAVESMLFGQSGLLERAPDDIPYVASLKRDYAYYAGRFGLKRPVSLNWKTGGMRPQNFPHRRIARLALMASKLSELTRAWMEAPDVESCLESLDEPLTGFWVDHASFSPVATGHGSGHPSAATLRTLAINVVVPLIHCFRRRRGDDEALTAALDMLQELPPESNSIVSLFADAGVKCRDALSSQALVQLRREYCEKRKCLFCRFGHRLLSRHATG